MRVLWRKQVSHKEAAAGGGCREQCPALPRCQGCAPSPALCPAQPSKLPAQHCLQPVPLTFGLNCIFSPQYLS